MDGTALPYPAPNSSAAAKTSSAVTYTLITEPADDLTPISIFLSSAKKSIDMTMYELTDITVTPMLGKAATAGVTVRVILDQKDGKKSNTPAYKARLILRTLSARLEPCPCHKGPRSESFRSLWPAMRSRL